MHFEKLSATLLVKIPALLDVGLSW